MENKDTKPLALEMKIDGKVQRFVTPQSLRGITFRSAATVTKQIEQGEIDLYDLDTYFQFVCDVFGNQFTITEFEYGVDPREQIDSIYAVALFVMGSIEQASQMLRSTVDQSQLDGKKKLT